MAEDRTIEAVRALYGATLDVGSGVVLRWVTTDGMVVGAIRDHVRPDNGTTCSSGVYFDVPSLPAWLRQRGSIHRLVSWEPFHLEPSLACRACPSHGFIRDGRWTPA